MHRRQRTQELPIALTAEDEEAQLAWAMAESLRDEYKRSPPKPAGPSAAAPPSAVHVIDGDDGDDMDEDLRRAIELSKAEAEAATRHDSWDGWERPPAEILDLTDSPPTRPATPPAALTPPLPGPTVDAPTVPPTAAAPVAAPYRLAAIVSHRGSTIHAGHYICDVQDRKTQQWKCYDDDVMSEIGGTDKLMNDRLTRGYLFFYTYQSS